MTGLLAKPVVLFVALPWRLAPSVGLLKYPDYGICQQKAFEE
jgi:hypothetical protein